LGGIEKTLEKPLEFLFFSFLISHFCKISPQKNA
jgi:hypothetical protein